MEMHLSTSLVVLWLLFYCKSIKRISQVDTGNSGSIFLGFSAKVNCIGVGGGKNMGPFYVSSGIHFDEEEGIQI